MKKVFTLLSLALLSIGTAWATDYTLGASTFNGDKTIATVGGVDFTLSSAHGGVGQTGYSEYIKFSKGKTYTITLPEGFSLTNINIKGYTNKDGKADGEITSIGGISQTEKAFPARNDANLSSEAAITTGYDFAISQTGGSVAITTANTNQICVLITITGTAAAAVAVDPVFSLSSTSISTSQTGQIKVGTKDNLDGIELSSITYGTSGIVTVDADGVITPVSTGTTTINFNSGAVADKYNASTGNSLTITVIEVVTIFAVTSSNTEYVLSRLNIQAAGNEFVKASTENWSSRTPSGYSTDEYYNLSGTSRFITFKVSGASRFQIVIQNGSGSDDRKYSVKIGDADAEEITAPKNTTSTSKVFTTGTTGEVTIQIIGGPDGSLYPAAIKFDPAATIAPAKEYTTYVTEAALDFTGLDLKAYVATTATSSAVNMEPVTTVPAGTPLVLKKGSSASYDVPVIVSADAPAVNNLRASDGVSTIGGDGVYDYILSNGMFYHASAGVLPAGKAYLHYDSAPGARESLEINFEDETTAISSVNRETINNNGYYNLSGQRVAQPTKGLYIVNGKKVIIK